MNILSFVDQKRKGLAATAGDAVLEASNVALHGMAYSIADAIEHGNTIKSRRVLKTSLDKLNTVVTKVLYDKKLSSNKLDTEEDDLFSTVGNALKEGVVGLVSSVGKGLIKMVGYAIEYAVIPAFTFFTSAAAAVVGLLVNNPMSALAIGTVLATGTAGYKLYKYLTNKEESASLPANPVNKVTAEIRTKGVADQGEIKSTLKDKDVARIKNWETKLGLASKEKAHNLQPGILAAVMAQESNGNPNAESKAGAKGLFQLMPVAVKELKNKGLTVDPLNPEQAAEGAAVLLSDLVAFYQGDYDKALVAYNAGKTALNQALKGKRTLATESLEYAGRVKGQFSAINNQPLSTALETGPMYPFGQYPPAQEQIATAQTPLPGNLSPSLIMPAGGTFSSPFGERFLLGKLAPHDGIDIANAEGSPIYAAAAGKVVTSGPVNGYGSLVAIDHGNITTRYGHTRKQFVNVGDYVPQGKVIAEMGNLGKSTGPHLHFEVRDKSGVAIDPASYLPDLPSSKGQPLKYSMPDLSSIVINRNGQPLILN